MLNYIAKWFSGKRVRNEQPGPYADSSAGVYVLEEPETPWGDYGHILIAGMTAHLGRKDGLLQLERTGPFVPPISFPGAGDVVVTDAFKMLMEGSGLTGFTFRPVVRARIVRLGWEKWDRTADEPQEYPESGEPEDYILDRPHSPEVTEQIGDFWEVCLEECATVDRVKAGPYIFDQAIYLVLSSWDGRDWFRADGVGYTYISEKAKTWVESTVPEWVAIRPAKVR